LSAASERFEAACISSPNTGCAEVVGIDLVELTIAPEDAASISNLAVMATPLYWQF
jgi:hypothetical protein